LGSRTTFINFSFSIILGFWVKNVTQNSVQANIDSRPQEELVKYY
jgi:hypothetical protein